MNEEQGFALHPLAARDIAEIWEYIAADNPLAARRVREEIYSAIRALLPFPRVGRRHPDLTSRPLRFVLAREYLIAYAPDETPFVDCRRHAWTPQPWRHGCNSQRPGIALRS